MTFEFIVAFKDNGSTDIKGELVLALSETLEANGNDFNTELIEQIIILDVVRTGSSTQDENGGTLTTKFVGFSIDLPDDTNQLDKIISELIATLNDWTPIYHVIKFEDPLLQQELEKRSREVFSIEMKLRKILSFIYLFAYPDRDVFDLLIDEIAKPMMKSKPEVPQMRKAGENQFFYLTFGQYVHLNTRPDLKVSSLIEIISNSEQYEIFRNEVLRSPVQQENDAELLAGLKQKMDAIEAMRNCIAHNRYPTTGIQQNYESAKPELESLLDQYLDSLLAASSSDIDAVQPTTETEQNLADGIE
jgi:hypothetical protein